MSCIIHPADEAGIREAVRRLKAGEVVGAPTETVYGLFADAANPQALRRLKELKGRDAAKPLQVMPPTHDWAKDIAVLSAAAERVCRAFFPGPLTLVLHRKPTRFVHPEVAPGQDTVGLRMPDHPAARALLAAFGKPLAATSANQAGGPDTSDAAQAAQALEGREIFLLEGKASHGRGSTVIDATGAEPRLLREGATPMQAVENLLKNNG